VNDFLDTPIEFLKGVGPKKGEILKKEIGVFTFKDLIYHFPFRYEDRSLYAKVKDLPFIDQYVQLKGTIIHVSEVKTGRTSRLVAKFQDDTGIIDLVWFQGVKWIKPLLKPNVLFHTPSRSCKI